MDIETCDHEFVNVDGNQVCLHCDVIIDSQLEQGYESRSYSSNSSSKMSVLDKIEGIPEEVKTAARASIIRKGEFFPKKVRDDPKSTFKELYVAYQNLKIPFNPDELAKKLGLGRKSVHSCLKSVSGTDLVPSIHDDGDSYCSIVMIHPVNLIEKKCKENGLEEYIDELKEIVRYILSDPKNPYKVKKEYRGSFVQATPKPLLIQSKPNHVACAVIKKFCDVNRIPVKSFAKTNELSDNALKVAIRDIEEFF